MILRRLSPATALSAASVVIATTACGADGVATSRGPELDGGLDEDSPGLALAERANALIKKNHDAECVLCATCGAFSSGDDACEGALLDSYPQAKPNIVCRIAAEEHAEQCLARTNSCNDAAQCNATAKTDSAACPAWTPPAATPTGC